MDEHTHNKQQIGMRFAAFTINSHARKVNANKSMEHAPSTSTDHVMRI